MINPILDKMTKDEQLQLFRDLYERELLKNTKILAKLANIVEGKDE